MFDVARLTKRIVLASSIVKMASEAVSAMTRELSTMSGNEAGEPGLFVVEVLAAKPDTHPDSAHSQIVVARL